MNFHSTAPSSIAIDSKVGHWQILKIVHRRALCRCDCGSTHEVAVAALEDGSSLSCGCHERSRPKPVKSERLPDWRPLRGR